MRAFHDSQKALLSEFSSPLRIFNARRDFPGEKRDILAAKRAASSQSGSGYQGYETTSDFFKELYSSPISTGTALTMEVPLGIA
jgi:hypothetical protein